MNLAYKHLESRLKIAELTIPQWLAVAAGVGLMIGWGLYLSPFGAYVTLLSAIYLGGIPIAAALLASYSDFDAWLLVRCAFAWWRADGRYLPGPGVNAEGYRLADDPADARRAGRESTHTPNFTALWDC